MGDYSRVVPPQHFFRTMETKKATCALCRTCMGKTMFLRELAGHTVEQVECVRFLFPAFRLRGDSDLLRKYFYLQHNQRLLKGSFLLTTFTPSDRICCSSGQVNCTPSHGRLSCCIFFISEARQLIDEVPSIYVWEGRGCSRLCLE